MLLQDVDAEGRLWFLTDVDARTVADVAHEAAVNVSFSAPRGDRYVSLSGRARSVRDPEKVDALWNPTFRAWFPRGRRDPILTLLAIEVRHAEYWLVPRSRIVRVVGAIRAVVTRRRYEAGTHGAFDIDRRRAA